MIGVGVLAMTDREGNAEFKSFHREEIMKVFLDKDDGNGEL